MINNHKLFAYVVLLPNQQPQNQEIQPKCMILRGYLTWHFQRHKIQLFKLDLLKMRKDFTLIILSLLCLALIHAAPTIHQQPLQPENQSSVNSRMLPSGTTDQQQFVQPPAFNNLNQFSNAQQVTFGTSQSQTQPNPNPPSNQQQQTLNGAVQTSTQPASQPDVNTPSPGAPVKEQPKVLLTQIGKDILGKGFKVDNGISYQRINIKGLDKKFFFLDFILAETDKWQQVNITITPDGRQEVIAKCVYDGQDTCYIASDRLKENETLFLTIQCQEDCSYKMNTRWSDTEHLKPGDEYVFTFGKQNFQIYHVELGNLQFQEFRVHVAQRATQRPFDNVKIYGKYGKNSPTSEDYDFKSTNLWEDGQGLFLKKKNMKDTNMYLLLVGQHQTTYSISCEIVDQAKHTIQNGKHLYEYLVAGDSKEYHIAHFDTQKYEEFSLKVSTLSGYIRIQYFFDASMTKPLPFEPFKYMDDSEYIFDSKQIAQFASTGIYIRISTIPQDGQAARDSTFTIKFNGRRKEEGVELNEHVYGFIMLKQQRFAYFNFKNWIMETEAAANLKFTVTTIQVMGMVNPEFRLCKSTIAACTDLETYENSSIPIKLNKHDTIGQKENFQLQIEQPQLKRINAVQKQGIIVVNLKVDKSKKDTKGQELGFSLIALEFVNQNKVLFLREDRPLEDRLMPGEMKIYKYRNSDQDVKQIRIHVNSISGIVKFSGVVKDPDSQNAIAVIPEGNTLKFNTNLHWPILITVSAQSRAIFGISMQVILKNQFHGDADVISIGQDLAYTVRIKPQTYTIFEVTPMFYQYAFKYESSQSVIACALNMSTGVCVNTDDRSTVPTLSFSGTISSADLSADRRSRVKITNPFGDSVAQVTVIFHSREFNHCDRKFIGKVYSQNVKNGTCVSYLVQDEQKTGLEIYISKREFANMQYAVFVCGNHISNVKQVRTLTITPQVLKQRCQNRITSKEIDILWAVSTDNLGKTDLQVKVDFVAQKLGGLVMLPQGLSYSVIELSQQGPLKTFGFSLINKKDTKIYVRQVIGKFRAVAKIVREEDRETEQISQVNYQYASQSTVDYSQDPVIEITKKNIEDAPCSSCALLIAVLSEDQPGRTVEFQIEVVQSFERLQDDRSVQGYLEAGSFAYYTYLSKPAEETTLIFFISDHNQQCSNMYLSVMENPGPKNQIAKQYQSNELIYIHRGPAIKYFLAVEAVKTCDYAISVLQIDSSIHRLERGKQNMIKLLKGETRFFTFQQYTNQPFKIISLSKFGEVRLYLNKSSLGPSKRTWSTTQLNPVNFQMKSEHTNTLNVASSDKIFCTKCDYFVAVQALSTTFSTLFLVYPETVIPLLKNKFFSDFILSKGQKTLASYNNVEKTKIQLTVHSGSLQITALYKEFKSSQNFAAKPDIQTMTIDVSSTPPAPTQPKGADPYFNSMQTSQSKERIPLNFIFEALSDKTSYTLEIKSLSEKGDMGGYAVYQNILAGEPNHVEISNTKVLCIDGHLREKNQEILISVSSDNQELFNSLIFHAKLRHNETVNFTKTINKNSLTLKLIDPEPKKKDLYGADNYQVCMKVDTVQLESKKQDEEKKMTEQDKKQIVSNQTKNNATEFEENEEITIKAVVTQVNSVNILPSDTDTVVKGTNTYLVHSDGQIMLDVFECKGSAKISYSDSLSKLEDQKSKVLESIGVSQQRHAVKISNKDVTFVKVASEHSVVRWLPMNYETEEGLGYLRFSAGDLRYSSIFKNIKIQFQPIQWVKKTKSTVKEVEYILYISDDSEQLEYAVQCDPDSSNKVMQFSLGAINFNGYSEKQKDYESYNVDKNFLQAKFNGSDYIYINIVAKMVLTLSPKVQKNPRFQTSISDEHEHYRFIYSRQQMPLESYKPNQLQQIPYHWLFMIVGSAVLVLLLATWLFTRKIAPMIARLRSSNLVEEPEPELPKDDLQVVPPSSDRNQRVSQIQVQTDEKMQG